MSDPTQGVPPVVGPPHPDPPPGAPPPPPPGPEGPDGTGPEDEGPDRRVIAIGALLGVIVVLLIALIIVRTGGGDADSVTSGSTTTLPTSTSASSTSTSSTSTSSTSTSSSTTTSATTSTAPAATAPATTRPTTTTTPPVTIAPRRCTGTTSPDDPGPVAETFYEAWQVRDRGCAESIGSAEAIDALFALDGSNTEGMLEACDPGDEIDGDEGGNGAGGSAAPVSVCTFRYEGGSALFDLRFGATVGWQVTAVDFRVD